MRNKKIIVIDSGVGGLHILKECQNLMPKVHFIYVADTFNAPYGEKSKKKLQKISLNLLKNLQDAYKPEAFIIACNTLTVNCIAMLRKNINLPIIGVEPALKQAKINGGSTILLATRGTLKQYSVLDKKINAQIKKQYAEQNLSFKNIDKVHKIYIPNLPTLIDENMHNLEKLKPLLENQFNLKKFKEAQNLVIGCTHFIAIKPILKSVLNLQIKIYDGAEAVAKHAQQIICADENVKKSAYATQKSNEKPSNILAKNSKNTEFKKSKNNNAEEELQLSKITFLTTDANPAKTNALKKYYLNM